MKINETIHEYLGRLMNLHRKLVNCGYSFKDKEVALIMLMGFPVNYESQILSLEHDENELTTQKAKARLLIEEKRIKRRDESEEEQKAMFTRNKSKVQNFTIVSVTETPEFKKPFANKRTIICFCCNKSGHVAKSCPQIRKGNKLKPKEDIYKAKMSIENKALNASDISEEDPNTWYLDRGATEHMRTYLNKMKNFKNIVSKCSNSKQADNSSRRQG